MPFKPEYPGEIPSLGWDVVQWCENYLLIPDGDRLGQPVRFTRSQVEFIVRLFRVQQPYGLARYYRRAARIAPKGSGKSPLGGFLALAMIGADVVPDGFDAAGRPVGRPQPSPLVQIAGVAEAQAGNIYELIARMVGEGGPLFDALPDLDLGQTRVNLGRDTVIVPVSSNAGTREGQRVTAAFCEEALALDTRLPTPEGWTTVGDVEVGDLLYDRLGQETRVTHVTEVFLGRPCSRVTFADGTSVVTDDGHLWATRVTGSHSKPQVRRTAELAALPHRGHYSIPTAAPVQRPVVELPLDPYVLGYWIGDGDAGWATVSVGDQDAEIIWAELERRGLHVHLSNDRHQRAKRLVLSMPGSRRNRNDRKPPGMRARLIEMGVLHNKHIPPAYLSASVSQRVDLLRGLMDSDGWAGTNGACVFAQNRRVIVDQVVELLRSLGQRPRVSWNADVKSRQGGCWKVQFTPRDLQPFLLPRKAGRVRPHSHTGLSVVKVEPVPSVPVKCIAVDNDEHLFLAGDYLVTHNTQWWVSSNGGQRLYGVLKRNVGKMSGLLAELSNAPEPGMNSVCEATIVGVRKGLDPDVLLDYREAVKAWDWEDRDQRREHLREVYGDALIEAGGWVDLERQLAESFDSTTDSSDAKRYYGNIMAAGSGAWLDDGAWKDCLDTSREIAPGDQIAIGFDGSRTGDSTVLRGRRIADNHAFTLGIWERPPHLPVGTYWEVPTQEVKAVVATTMARYKVVRAYFDPPYWQDELSEWAGQWPEQVIAFNTNRDTPMAAALERLHTDIVTGAMTHTDDSAVALHYGNAYRRLKGSADKPLVLIKKERPESPRKIDAVMADALAGEARADAIEAGLPAELPADYYTVYDG